MVLIGFGCGDMSIFSYLMFDVFAAAVAADMMIVIFVAVVGVPYS